jgi:carboxymethylenebutenolidase
MIERELEVAIADGKCDAAIYENEDGKPRPGVIHYPDIMGIRPAHRAMAKRLAEAGYTVLLVNPFYRTARAPLFDFPPNFAGDPRTLQRFGELAGPLTPEVMEKDASALVDFLAGQKSVSGAKMGAVGYCFTGQYALRTASSRPDKIGAIASFHGGGLWTDKPTSPHLVLARIPKSNGPQLYFGHAFNDSLMPQDAINKLNEALKSWGGKYESEVYEDSPHGWTVNDSAAYRKPQAERAFDKMKALFLARLK